LPVEASFKVTLREPLLLTLTCIDLLEERISKDFELYN